MRILKKKIARRFFFFPRTVIFGRASAFVADIVDDMKEECQKYGSVVSLLIPRENPGKGQVRP